MTLYLRLPTMAGNQIHSMEWNPETGEAGALISIGYEPPGAALGADYVSPYIPEGQEANTFTNINDLNAHVEALTQSFESGDGGYGEDFGQTGLDWAQLEGKNPEEIFNILQGQGFIPDDAAFSDWIDDILNMPIYEGISDADKAAATAETTETVYGLETEIARAGEDIETAKAAYTLAEQRGQEDIATAGEGARSDIYGLQTQGAQQRRQGMFGKGMGGGMQRLAQQDISSRMEQQGASRMAQLGETTKGLTRGIEDAKTTETAALLGYGRDIADATTDLYGTTAGLDGIVGTADDTSEAVGGVYGAGGSEATTLANLTADADVDYEGDLQDWLSVNLQD